MPTRLLHFRFLERVQSRFYEPSERVEYTPAQHNTESNGPKQPISIGKNHDGIDPGNHWKSDEPVEQIIAQLLSPQCPPRFVQLKPLGLTQLIPSMLVFFGVTFYWLFGFGWYGPLTFLGVAIFGTLAGELYVHYAV